MPLRVGAIGMSFLALAVPFVALSGLAIGTAPTAIPAPEFVLDVEATQEGRLLTYTIRFDNVGDGAATSAILRDVLPDRVTYVGDPQDVVDGVWTKTYTGLGPGSYSETVVVALSEGVADGDVIANFVELRYVGWSGGWQLAAHTLETRASFPAAPVPTPFPAWVAIAPVAPAVAAAGGLVAYRRHRKPKLEQVFLMHNSGTLIHHWAANTLPSHDIDILSGMFVILKEFVRDSFRGKPGDLKELHFGDSRVFLAEGRHSILAAVVTGRHVNGMPGQIRAAVEDFERRHGSALEKWAGQLDRVPDAKAVVEALVLGKYGFHRRNA